MMMDFVATGKWTLFKYQANSFTYFQWTHSSSLYFGKGKKKHTGLSLSLLRIPSSVLPIAEQVQSVNFSANSFNIETFKNDSDQNPRAHLHVAMHFKAPAQGAQRAAFCDGSAYSCNQAGLCPRSGAQPVSSHKAQGFYITALLSRVWTIFPRSASFGWPTVQFVCCDCIRSCGGGGNKGESSLAVVSFSVAYVRRL